MTQTVTQMKPRAQDLHERMGIDLYHAAYARGMSLSAWLQEVDDGQYNDGLDAFSRQIKLAGIVTRSRPELGMYAGLVSDFDKDHRTRALWLEFVNRRWREVSYGRATYLSQDAALGTIDSPWGDSLSPRWDTQLAPAIPLAELIAVTTPITGGAYRTFYLEQDVTQTRMVRVGESAEIPEAKLTSRQHDVQLYKYGRRLTKTYEQMRRMRIDRAAFHIQQMAVQAETDKVATVLDVLVNGDGNTDTAAQVYNLTTLDAAAVAGTLTLKGYLAFKLKFTNPYMMTTALVQEAVGLQMLLLNVGSANVPLVTIQNMAGFGSFSQINQGLADAVRLGITADAPALKIVGFDRRLAIERVIEINSTISEVQNFITNQTQTMTMTETEGYAVLDTGAAKILDVNA